MYAKIDSNYWKKFGFSFRNVQYYPRYQDTNLLPLCYQGQQLAKAGAVIGFAQN